MFKNTDNFKEKVDALVEHLSEGNEDYKEVYSAEMPHFTFLIQGQLKNGPEWGLGKWNVYVNGESIGQEDKLVEIGTIERDMRLNQERTIWVEEPIWKVTHGTNRKGRYTISRQPYFYTMEAAAEWLWNNRINPEGRTGFYYSESSRRVMLDAIEDENDEFKDFAYDPLTMAKVALERAGFQIDRAEIIGDHWLLEFSFPAPQLTVRRAGLKRAEEILEPLIPLRTGNWTMFRQAHAKEGWWSILVRARIDNDPRLWKILRIINPRTNYASDFFKVIYNGQEVGRVFCGTGGYGEMIAEKVREEMAQLHKILPFYPNGWQEDVRAPWAEGPAANWWLSNRSKLSPSFRNALNLNTLWKSPLDPNYGLPD